MQHLGGGACSGTEAGRQRRHGERGSKLPGLRGYGRVATQGLRLHRVACPKLRGGGNTGSSTGQHVQGARKVAQCEEHRVRGCGEVRVADVGATTSDEQVQAEVKQGSERR